MKTYDKNNIFAKIIRGEIKANKVYEDDKILAFHDISKAAPTHILVIPKDEYINFSDFVAKADKDEIFYFFTKVGEIAKQIGIEEKGFRLITNNGYEGGQTIEHFHIHLLAGKKLTHLVSN